ncbi:MAG TPA: LamG domain-containing protein [Flavobacterium sp.]|nr:LamG domain-containing protein [Flavobacterium sp.]
MKIDKSFIKKAFGIAFVSLLFIGCQNMDRPELGDYPKDANAPGGPLKFYVAFDGTTANSLMNAVDSIRAKFPTDNPLESTAGISGKALKGGKPKLFVSYSKPNDFVANSASFTVAFWSKHGPKTQTEFVFSLLSDNWAKANMFCLLEGTDAAPSVKFFVDEQPGDHWFEWVNGESVPGLYDGQWHHLAFVYDALTSGMTLYKDGIAFPTKKWANHGNMKIKDSKVLGFRIGGSGNPAEGWMNSWTGDLDQFRMYSKPLTVAEINELYTKKK